MKPHHRNHRQFKETSRRKSAEATAGSVDEAIIKVLTELRVPKERARIEVLDEGKPKILGLFGGRPAKVRATLKGGFDTSGEDRGRGGRESPAERSSERPSGERPSGDRPSGERGERRERGGRDRDRERGGRDRDRDRDRGGEGREQRPARPTVAGDVRAEEVRVKAAEMLRLLGAEPAMTAEEKNGEVWLTVATSEMDGLLIGRRGETLTAIEHLLTRMSSLHDRDRVKVIMDVGGYRSRKGGAPAEGGMPAADAGMDDDDEFSPEAVLGGDADLAEGGAESSENGEGGEAGEARKRRRRGRRGRGGRSEGGRDLEGGRSEESELSAPRGFEPRGLPVTSAEPEMEGPGGALLDESMLEPDDMEPDFEAAEPVVAETVAPPVRDPEDDFDDEALRGGRPRGEHGGRSGGGGGGRDRDRGGRGGRDGGRGGRDRDRGGRGRDRDRGDRPEFETTPEIRASITESKRLEQELLAKMSPAPAAPEVGATPEAQGPKMPTFKKATKKRRGYIPPGE